MFYLVLKNTVVGGLRVKAGDVVEIFDTNESSSLVAMGRVEATSAPEPKKEKSVKKFTNRSITDFDKPEDE
jgi:hypothetical protein